MGLKVMTDLAAATPAAAGGVSAAEVFEYIERLNVEQQPGLAAATWGSDML